MLLARHYILITLQHKLAKRGRYIMSKKNTKSSSVEMVNTRDGHKVPVTQAQTLNYQRVLLSRLMNKNSPMGRAFQGILNDLKKDPRIQAVHDTGSDHAKVITELVEEIKISDKLLKSQDLTAVPLLWIPLVDAIKEHQKFTTVQETTTGTTDAEEKERKAREDATKRLEERARREQEKRDAEKAKADRLTSLSLTATEQMESKVSEEEQRRQVAERILFFSEGKATVDNNRHPTALMGNDSQLAISHPKEVAKTCIDVGNLVDVEITCCFCENNNRLGEVAFSYRNSHTGEMVDIFSVQFVWLSARTEDGAEEYCHIHGDKQGQLRQQPVLVCAGCAKLIKEVRQEIPEGLRPSNPRFAYQMVRDCVVKLKEEHNSSIRPTLRATVAERHHNKGGERRRHHHGCDEE